MQPIIPLKSRSTQDSSAFVCLIISFPFCFDSSGPANSDPHYERVFLLDPQYQNPAVLRNKLPELSQSAEASGTHLTLGTLTVGMAERDIWGSTRGFSSVKTRVDMTD